MSAVVGAENRKPKPPMRMGPYAAAVREDDSARRQRREDSKRKAPQVRRLAGLVPPFLAETESAKSVSSDIQINPNTIQ
ncbi:hypothetical protein KEX41_02875 [Burkholderia thailandensis]|uniref:hypothetical protein n=1 Tax=Burkholderia thailandensis TaxID=57975 RepID=UPI00192E26B3|nr:hypothetical protein [Burkholderia thailandensis]MBS2127193.1 hypothetical protein [Burkholderia thailandensis]QRA12361.1 hypothetical protein JMY07_07420 [Burkholderia thailandensis]